MRILHIISSPRGVRSVSHSLTSQFVKTLQAREANVSVDTLNVWDTDLPAFDGAAIEAKYADLAGEDMSGAQKSAWEAIQALGRRFHEADVLLFGVPMWNFGIPYRLKHLIDAVSQRSILFDFNADGMTGLLGGRTMVVCAARGVVLGPDFPAAIYDQQVSYLRTWGRMVGIKDIRAVEAEATLDSEPEGKQHRDRALAEVTQLAESMCRTI